MKGWRLLILALVFAFSLFFWAIVQAEKKKKDFPRKPPTLQAPAPLMVIPGPGVKCRRAPQYPVILCRCDQPERECVSW